ncbi:uncharacterized protein METZ01_LOCUS260379, partial [marine metagenome]
VVKYLECLLSQQNKEEFKLMYPVTRVTYPLIYENNCM